MDFKGEEGLREQRRVGGERWGRGGLGSKPGLDEVAHPGASVG